MKKYQPSQTATAAAIHRDGPAAARHVDEASTSASSTRGRLRMIAGAQEDPRRFASEVLLIRNWLSIIRHCATVTAHGTMGGQLPDYGELRAVLDSAEEAIATRLSSGPALLDGLAGWEASLLHHAPGIAPGNCLVCHRAREIPADLPADYAWALRVIDEAA